ncbi:FixH family protein [Aestuariivirga sp.]|jgi:nitrogen fixation protein FixH|uniref:FixH family protein n=1 Tax=Aestuariivirga sp. TaxID=2650926 RepID=UPI00378484A1
MTRAATERQLTGWHVLAMLVAFFGVILGVNLTLAYFANSTWSGLVVANGYVASQSFDEDLARARAQEALGWTVAVSFERDSIKLSFTDAQGSAIDRLAITGKLERTVTDKQDQALTFASLGGGAYAAPATLSAGVWEVEVDARGDGVPNYRKTFRFFVQDPQ